MICPKCKQEFSGTPYCVKEECISYSVTGFVVDPVYGYLTTAQGHKYPLPGLPIRETLNTVALIKRLIIANVKFLFRNKITLLGFGLLIMRPKRMLYEFLMFLGILHEADYAKLLYLEPKKQCKTARELMRTLEVINPREGRLNLLVPKSGKTYNGWMFLIVAIIQQDLAYRFRFQDIMSELNRTAFSQNPRKELMRLIDLLITREMVEGVEESGQASKYLLFKRFASILWLAKPFRDFVKAFMLEINTDELKMSIYDWYWVSQRYEYNYGGKTYAERAAWRAKEHEGWVEPPMPDDPMTTDDIKPRLVVNKPNQAFYQLPFDKAAAMAEDLKQVVIKNHLEHHHAKV